MRKKVLAVTVPVRAGEGAGSPVPASSVEAPRAGDAPRQVAPTRPYGPTHPASARPPAPGPAVGPGGTAFYTPPTFPAEPAPPAAGAAPASPSEAASTPASGAVAPPGQPRPARSHQVGPTEVPARAAPGPAATRPTRPIGDPRLTVELDPDEVAQVRGGRRRRTRLLVVALLVVTASALAYVFWPGG